MMHIRFESDKDLFAIFLLINAAGYDVENNPSGMHPIRQLFRSSMLDEQEKDANLFQMLTILRSLPLPRQDLIRFAHLAVQSKKQSHLFNDPKKNNAAKKAWGKMEKNFARWKKTKLFFNGLNNTIIRLFW